MYDAAYCSRNFLCAFRLPLSMHCLMTFDHYNDRWYSAFLAPDCRTPLGRRFSTRTDAQSSAPKVRCLYVRITVSFVVLH